MGSAGDDDGDGGELARERDADAREHLRHLRNVLSVVRVLAERTAEEVGTVEEFRAVFDGRLGALSRGQSAFGDPRAGRELGAIFGDELLGFGMGVGAEVELAGPPVRLTPRAAGVVALAAHELACASAGVRRNGPVRVEWALDDALSIEWVEPLRADEEAPTLPYWVEQVIAYELRGGLAEERAEALRRRIRLPMATVLPD